MGGMTLIHWTTGRQLDSPGNHQEAIEAAEETTEEVGETTEEEVEAKEEETGTVDPTREAETGTADPTKDRSAEVDETIDKRRPQLTRKST